MQTELLELAGAPVGAGGYTDRLVRLAHATAYEDLPQGALRASKRLILDTVGCMIGSRSMPSVRILTERLQSFGGVGESTVLVSGGRLPSPMAAYLNGHAANALDAEETTLLMGHLSAGLVAPALALAERQASSGRDLIAAVAIGFEVAARVGLAVHNNMAVDSTSDVRMSSVFGHSWTAFGGTAAGARLLGLGQEQTLHAFGLTGSTTPIASSGHCVTLPLPRPMSKYAMYGAFAQAAVLACLLAGDGFTSDPSIFDGDNGFWRMTGSLHCDFDKLTHDWGQRWLVEDASFKLYPSCRFAHPVIDMALALQRQHGLRAEEIERIDIEMPPPAFSMRMDERGQGSPVDAQFDTARQVATALIGRLPPGPAWLAPKTGADPAVRWLADRVFMEPAPDSNALVVEQIRSAGRPTRMPSRIAIRTREGVFSEERFAADGDPWADRAFDDVALAAKFRNYTRDALSPAQAEAAIEHFLALEDCASIQLPVADAQAFARAPVWA